MKKIQSELNYLIFKSQQLGEGIIIGYIEVLIVLETGMLEKGIQLGNKS